MFDNSRFLVAESIVMLLKKIVFIDIMNSLSLLKNNIFKWGNDMEIKNLCINTMRTLSADAIQKAKSGHPGLPLGASPMAFTLFNDCMKISPKNPNWFDRDRFILSAGHGSMLLY